MQKLSTCITLLLDDKPNNMHSSITRLFLLTIPERFSHQNLFCVVRLNLVSSCYKSPHCNCFPFPHSEWIGRKAPGSNASMDSVGIAHTE